LGSSCESAPSISSQVASPAMALLRFVVSTAHQAKPIGSGLASRFHPSPGFVPPDGLLPTWPCRRIHCRLRSRDSPLEACLRPDRYRFPGPCPLAVSRRPSLQLERAPLQGFDPRTELPEVVDRPPAASSGFPSRVFSSAALAHGFSPGPSSLALSAPFA
jgi:hypothetical protein